MMDKIKLTTPILHSFYDWAVAHKNNKVNHNTWNSCIVGQFNKFMNYKVDCIYSSGFHPVALNFDFENIELEQILNLLDLCCICNTYSELKNYMLKYFEKV